MRNSEVGNRLLEVGIRLFRERGYHGTGIQQIASAAGIPKGSFCYYFGSKEEFASAVIERYADRSANSILAYAYRTELSAGNRLWAFFSETEASCALDDCRYGCAIGNLLAEIGDANERLRGDLEAAWKRMALALEQLIAEAQSVGEVDADHDTNELAEYLLSGWEGALIAMRAKQSTAPLRLFIQHTLRPLLNEVL